MRRFLLALPMLAAGCGQAFPEPARAPSSSRAALTTTNGSNLNGSNLNGSNLNGSNLNGSNLNGPDLSSILASVSYAGATWNSAPVSNLHLEGTTLVGDIGASTWRGAELTGLQLQGNAGDGSTVALTVDAVAPAPSPNSDLDLYAVSFLGSDGASHPLCTDSTGAPLYATAVAGRWNYGWGVPGGGSKTDDPATFTFACDHAAIFKCVMWGYRPWASLNGVSLEPYHQTCTRLVRADYCGDGTSYTVDGTLINLYDDLGIQTDTESWLFEADWNPDGATCFSPLNRSHELVPCYDSKVNLLCGLEDAMMTDETPTGGLTNYPVAGL